MLRLGKSRVRTPRKPSSIARQFLDQRIAITDQQTSLFDDTDIRRVNQFDWQKAFPEVMARGGFDVIYGNPPYVRVQVLNEWAPLEVEYCKQRYLSAGKGNYDIWLQPDDRLGLTSCSRAL